MRVVLRPVPEHPNAVGLIDGQPLTYEGRVPHVGDRPVEHGTIAEALSDAVEAAAGAVFGGDYVNALARATGLNRRTVTRDRVLRNGLPAWALEFLARAAAYEHPRAMGYMLQAAAEMSERGVLAQGDTLPGVHPRDREHLAVVARLGLEEALELVAVARDAKRLPIADKE
ncbi:hypothetical protein [Methylobacterium brachiatum]|jgi:hypothetical protein|uniref:hypothetical protein n=1 Tax=Methylobacterium brachiatum TaxID=269660 RepID=UPI000EFC834A|nr:hypothetical protein [Methylobacterium brachiatum]AYO83072.1 hypothetical protein EBB05_12900 [Methylobacterium brachiatum]